jgi:hypothetical protein
MHAHTGKVPTPILVRNRRVSQGGRIPLFPSLSPSLSPPLFSGPNLQFFNEINDLKYVSYSSPLPSPTRTFWEKLLLTHHPCPPPDFSASALLLFLPHFTRSMKVHELRHGILQALPQAKPSYGGARCPRIAYTADISYTPLVAIAIVVVVRRRLFFLLHIRHSQSHRTQSL